jgi:hypothetical protein
MVRALTGTPGVHYDSAPDSGHSVDNLPPAPPAPFTGAYASGATHLHWGASTEADFWYYALHRGSTADFTPGPENRIATCSSTGYVDVGPAGSHYKLAAVDVNGNESGYAALGPEGTVGVPGAASAFALDGVRPNPALGGRMLVHFTLPTGEPAELELIDVAGRRVIGRAVGSLGAGRHAVDLAAGCRVPPGLYLVQLTQGTNTRVVRAAILD